MAEGDDEKDATIAKLRRDEADLRKKLRDAEGKVAQLEAKEADQDKVIATAKAEGAAEERSKLTAEHAKALAGAEVRARAARTLADPDDAVKFLDLSEVVGGDGKVDGTKIDEQLKELVEKKPYLAVSGAGGAGGGGSGGGGSGDGGGSGGDGGGDGTRRTPSWDGGARQGAGGNADEDFNAVLRKAAGRG